MFAVTTELAISGYPPRDLLLQADFIEECHETAKNLQTKFQTTYWNPLVLIGEHFLETES